MITCHVQSKEDLDEIGVAHGTGDYRPKDQLTNNALFCRPETEHIMSWGTQDPFKVAMAFPKLKHIFVDHRFKDVSFDIDGDDLPDSLESIALLDPGIGTIKNMKEMKNFKTFSCDIASREDAVKIANGFDDGVRLELMGDAIPCADEIPVKTTEGISFVHELKQCLGLPPR